MLAASVGNTGTPSTSASRTAKPPARCLAGVSPAVGAGWAIALPACCRGTWRGAVVVRRAMGLEVRGVLLSSRARWRVLPRPRGVLPGLVLGGCRGLGGRLPPTLVPHENRFGGFRHRRQGLLLARPLRSLPDVPSSRLGSASSCYVSAPRQSEAPSYPCRRRHSAGPAGERWSTSSAPPASPGQVLLGSSSKVTPARPGVDGRPRDPSPRRLGT